MVLAFSLLMFLGCDDVARHPVPVEHVRALDERTGALLRAGVARSSILRAIVRRLNESDVVAYLRFDASLSEQLAGQLQFLTAAAGRRYVVVTMGGKRWLPRDYQIAALGHELRHALEVADTPAIVGAASLQSAYERIGFISRRVSASSFETDAAREAGESIRRELSPAGLLVPASSQAWGTTCSTGPRF